MKSALPCTCLLAVSAVFALSACEQKPAATPPVAEAPAALPTVEEAIAIVDKSDASLTSGDAERIMSFYANDAVFVDSAVNEPTSDRAQLAKSTAAFVAMRPANLSLANRMIQVLDADTIVSTGIANLTGLVSDQPVPMAIRFTAVHQKQADGNWLIVNEHLSNVVPPPPASSAAPPAE